MVSSYHELPTCKSTSVVEVEEVVSNRGPIDDAKGLAAVVLVVILFN